MLFRWASLLILLSAVIFLYLFTGLNNYVYARLRILDLPKEERRLAIEKLRGVLGTSQSKGILGRVITVGWGSVLVWGVDGPKLYKVDENSVFAYWDACEGMKPKNMIDSKGVAITIPKEVYSDINVWKNKVKSGDVITIVQSMDGKQKGVLREAWVTDWWSFLPGDMEVQCAK